MRFLADENFLRSAVEALRKLSHDVAWLARACNAPHPGDHASPLDRCGD